MWLADSSSASKSIILYWDTIIPSLIDLEIILGKSTFCKPTWEVDSLKKYSVWQKIFCAGWVINHNPPLVTLDIRFCERSFVSDLPAFRIAIACWLSDDVLVLCLLYKLCRTYPPRYWMHDLSLSENTVFSSLLLSLGDLTLLQYASRLSATLIANNVAAFQVNPLKNVTEFTATVA